ncbi:MAG: hypothetical protein GY849_03505 [Deltaproteobacteria bacterium]|nr:hypothetical protein [Deltaproteobacteria bacterium]
MNLGAIWLGEKGQLRPFGYKGTHGVTGPNNRESPVSPTGVVQGLIMPRHYGLSDLLPALHGLDGAGRIEE